MNISGNSLRSSKEGNRRRVHDAGLQDASYGWQDADVGCLKIRNLYAFLGILGSSH